MCTPTHLIYRHSFPPHCVLPRIYLVMAPKGNTDVLSDAEEQLVFNAIRLDAAVRYRTLNPDQVDDAVYAFWMDREIVRFFICSLIYSITSIAEGS